MSNARQKENKNNEFYAKSYNSLISVLIGEIILLIVLAAIVLYQIFNRPLPLFTVTTPNKQNMELSASYEPDLLPNTLIRWASKAAVAAYTFDFVNYVNQIEAVRPYFTEAGWRDYQASVAKLIQTIAQNQLFVNGVVSGPPVISNQGDLPERGYVWRIQMPFLVTYQSAGATTHAYFTVILTIVRVPTTDNPAGVGIDQFVMT